VRESILFNLKKRFEKAGIKKYKSFVADLTGNQSKGTPSGDLTTGNYDLIIADVPCTGSGTWGRTPEQLFYFDNKKIDAYASIQKKIAGNTIRHLSKDGYLLYITCSVFKKENEENVRYLREKFNLGLVRQEILKGYDKKADTLFAALLKHSL
jgi:16S rRNA (cytosine967-C5)-methyltransferase